MSNEWKAMSMGNIVIKTENLTKAFKVGFRGKNVAALKGLNLEVNEGEIFGFLGPNGAGKTTTIKILMGLIYPTAGKAWILDKEVGDVEIKNRIGFLPEQPYFYDYLTSREFLLFYGQLFGLAGDELRARMNNLLSLVGLEDASDLQLRKFSKGMLQRIGIAQALINVGRSDEIMDARVKYVDIIARNVSRETLAHIEAMGFSVYETGEHVSLKVKDEYNVDAILQ